MLQANFADQVSGRIATLTFNRDDVRNALSSHVYA